MSTISDRLLECIKKKKYSFSELSELSGIPKSTIQRYATAKTDKIPINTISNLAKALNVNPAYIIGWVDDPEPVDYKQKERTYIYSINSFNPEEIRMLEVYHKSSPETQQIIRLLLAKEQGIPAIAEQECPVADNTDNESSRIKDK